MEKTIHLGIIGAGAITVNPGRHLDSLKELKETDWELSAICDVVPRSRRESRREVRF